MAWNEVREWELELELEEDDLAVAFDDLAGLVGFAAEADDEGVLIMRMRVREERRFWRRKVRSVSGESNNG